MGTEGVKLTDSSSSITFPITSGLLLLLLLLLMMMMLLMVGGWKQNEERDTRKVSFCDAEFELSSQSPVGIRHI